MIDKPLSIDQKSDLLKELQEKLKNPASLEVLANLLYSAIVKDNDEGFPEKIADFICDFAGPYTILEKADPEHKIYDEQVVQPQISKHCIRLFEANCNNVESWSSARLLKIADLLNIDVKPAPIVKIAIYMGKLYWRIHYEKQMLAKNNEPLPPGEDKLDYITMTLDDFTQFRHAGKRSGHVSTLKYTDADKKEVTINMSRPNRNPRYDSGPNKDSLDHSNIDLCHTCAWDVDEYRELSLHRDSVAHRNSEPRCDLHDHVKVTLQLKYDHIPSYKHLDLLNKSKKQEEHEDLGEQLEGLEADEEEEENPLYQNAFRVAIDKTSEQRDQIELQLEELVGPQAVLRDHGICIAAPSIWDERGRTMKAKNINGVDHEEEIIAPAKAVRRDIKNYIKVLRENHESPSSLLLRFGAFRYLYRQNGKREEAYFSDKTDQFFTRELKEIIERKDCGRSPAPHLVPSK